MATARHRKRLTAGHGAARAPRGGRPSAALPPPTPARAASFAPSPSPPLAAPLPKSPAARAPGAPAPPRPGGSPAGKDLRGAARARLCVPAPQPALPRARRAGSGGGAAGSSGSPPGCERAGERARPAQRPPARTHPCQSRHAALARPRAPETLPRPPARPQRCLGPCVARCTAMAVRAGSIRSLLTLSTLVTLLSTQPRPHWLPPSQPPLRLVEALPLS